MLHEPAPVSNEPDHAVDEKARLGVRLFLVYSAVYLGFVVICTAKPALMGRIVFAGLNLAVVYGFGLIILAVGMGLVYHLRCSRMEDDARARHEAGNGGAP